MGELSKKLESFGHMVKIYKNIFDGVDKDTHVLISTNGRLDAILAKFWCTIFRKMLIIPGQSGFGWDDKLNLWVFPDVFVGLTQYQCDWAYKINPHIKIVKIPNGVDLDKFNPKVKPIMTKLTKPIILNVGVVGSFKRQNLLTAASHHSLLLIGKGVYVEYKHDEMPSVYTACDLFSYPTSPSESFGISMLEAMASGLPVVATDDPIRREIVEDAGLFVDPTDRIKYSQALDKALLTNWGDKPRKQAEKFSWVKIAKQYEDICCHNY